MAVATVLAFQEGGYFITSWGVAAIVLWGALVALLVVAPARLGGWPGVAAVASLLVLAVWQGVSSDWAFEPSAAVAAMALTLLYAAALGLGLAAGGGRRHVVAAMTLALAVTVLVAVAGVGARLFPDVIGGDDVSRLNTPISYWNGLGALFAFGIVLAVGLAGTASLPRALRVPALAAVPLLGVGLYLTLSRGAILLLGVALLALVLLAPDRLETVVALAVGGAGALVPTVMAAQRDLTSLGFEPLRAGEGPRHAVALALLVCTVLVAAAALLAALATPRIGAGPRRVAGAVLVALAVIWVVGGYVAYGPDEDPVSWADAQFESFRSFDSGERTDASVASQLATAAGTGRWQNWSVAVDQWRDAPLVGTGAGEYRFWWNEHRPMDQFVVNAHSVYLEVMGESGLLGLLLLVVPLVLGAVLIVMVLVRRGPPAPRRDLVVAGCAAALIALHAMGDWDWQLPAVMIPALVVGGAALRGAAGALGWDRRLGLWAPVGAGVVALVVVAVVAGPTTAQATVDDAKAAARAGDLARALELARDAGDRDPSSPAPRLVEAYVLTDLGRAGDADAAFGAALARSPRDWSVMADWAGSLIARGEYRAATPLIRRARELNPREPRMTALERVLAARTSRASR